MGLNLNEVKQSSGSSAPLLEAGTYPARVVQIVDLGLQANTFDPAKPPRQKVRVTYELVSEFLLDDEGNEDETKPRLIGEAFFLSHIGNEKGTSTQRIKAYDPKNETGGDLTRCVGSACMLTIVHQQPKDKTKNPYAKVATVTPPPKGFPIPEAQNPAVVFLLDEPDLEVYNTLIDFVKEDIKGAVNFAETALANALECGHLEEQGGY